MTDHGRSRAVIENVSPAIDGGRWAIKRTVGEKVRVEADIFADGHDVLAAVLKYWKGGETEGNEVRMQPLGNDRWRGEFSVREIGTYFYTIEAWVDRFASWQRDLEKKLEAGQPVAVELRQGADIIEAAARGDGGDYPEQISSWAAELRGAEDSNEKALAQKVLSDPGADLMARTSDRRSSTVYEKELRVIVDPERARFSSWYEMFPRSCAPEPGRHGTFKDCEAQLARIAEMGFNVLYFPPIHPIGRSFRKGKNNNPICEPGEPGSPWAIGAAEGGHKAVHPELGTLEDFRRLAQRARDYDIELALDIAFQCSPDHPYAREHPEWFHKRPDGSIQHAENPPKKYEDIYPFDFECEAWKSLWHELKSIFDFWIGQGVRIFRVDNPHTKALPFWEWCLGELKREHPELIFLAEAFTRPKVMYRLAKLGFTQSYNYFPWRNRKDELAEYFSELARPPLAEFFRSSLWPNTPDILTQYLQNGGRFAFMIRLVLAATLGTSYGIYGPAFELCENGPIEAGSEEYLNSEKYAIRAWNLDAVQNLTDLITRVNRIRRENPALQSSHRLQFHPIDNDQLIAYTKTMEDGTGAILTVVNLDPHHTHHGWLELPIKEFGLDPDQTYQMHDLLTGERFLWKGARNYVELSPRYAPAHLFRLRQLARSEKDFDYYI